MSTEIERKFLVKGEYRSLAQSKSRIVQGYLYADARKTIRIRIRGDKAYVTIKGPSADNGLSRFEWETEISIADAEEMMSLCEPGLIDKERTLRERGRTEAFRRFRWSLPSDCNFHL